MAIPGRNPASPESQESCIGITVDQIDWPMVPAVSERELKEAADSAKVPLWPEFGHVSQMRRRYLLPASMFLTLAGLFTH